MARRKRTSSSLFRKRAQKVGLPPGTLVHVGEKKTEKVVVRVVFYDAEGAELRELDSLGECTWLEREGLKAWIDVQGLHDVALIEKIGQCFGLHALLLEDVVDTNQRPKLEDYGTHTYVVLRNLKYDRPKGLVISEQVSLAISSGLVLSFQEGAEDLFSQVRERLLAGKGKIRQMGPDYLLYCLIDNIVDNYFPLLEHMGEELEELEEAILSSPTPQSVSQVHRLRREMLTVRKALFPLREVLGGLVRGESAHVGEAVRPFLRDVYDHTVEVMDTLETYRDMAAAMIDVYLSSVNNRLNEIMKFLTMISTIFIPLTFIAGIYGMNFEFMPELKWQWGYPAALGLMAAISGFMLWYFKRKGWL